MSNREPTITLHEWLQEKPFTLALPSKFFGVFAHSGADAALAEAGLTPSRLRGSSGGTNQAGLRASGLMPPEIRDFLLDIDRKDFWDPGFGFGLLKGQLFDRILREVMPVTTFEEAVIPVSISVFDIWSRKTEVIETGDLVDAIRASSAVPGLFHPVMINRRPKVDGGIKDHAGLAGAKPGERILFHDLSPAKHQFDPSLDVLSVTCRDIPAVNPFRLRRGIDAYKAAKENMQRSLELHVPRQH